MAGVEIGGTSGLRIWEAASLADNPATQHEPRATRHVIPG